MKKIAIVIPGIFFIILTVNVFAGDFAGDLKDGFKNTVNYAYKITGNVPIIGSTVQVIQKNMYNTQLVPSYNLINVASNVLTGAGIGKHINTAFQFGVLDTYKTTNNFFTTLTGSGIEQFTRLLPEPLQMGAEKLRLYAINYPYAGMSKPAPLILDGEKILMFSSTGTKEEANEMNDQFERVCRKDEHFKNYYNESSQHVQDLLCTQYLLKKGYINDYKVVRFNTSAENASHQAANKDLVAMIIAKRL